MKKCLFAVALLAALLVSSICYAANTGTSGLFSYAIKGNGTVEITGFDWARNREDIYVPQYIDGYSVTSIGEKAFARETEVKFSGYEIEK
ncbi:MAG: hypothetical protein MJ136_04205 [Clostridia bacterium]|nr:hypothetical protein [Clostridia bacterium]